MSNVIDFKAIGTYWWIEIFDELEQEKVFYLKNGLINLTKVFEQSYSRFLETSLVSKLNKKGFLRNPPNELLMMLELGEKARNITKGHFNIAVGRLLEEMGYDAGYSFRGQMLNVKCKMSNVEEDDYYVFSKEKIELQRDVHIDLGGIGKGFLIDRVKDFLSSNKVQYFFINAGGDIYATSEYNNPIEFALENPFNVNQMIGKVKIKNESIASSSPARRRWREKNSEKEFHHLIDMKTNSLANEIAGVFTLAKTATDSDLASTAIFVSSKKLHNQIASAFSAEYMVVFNDGSYLKSSNYKAELL